MARYGAIPLLHHVWDAVDMANDANIAHATFTRPVKIEAIKIVPVVLLDTDNDTVAFDVSYSTDGFVASDVEIAAQAAAEFATGGTNAIGTLKTAVDLALTAAAQDADGTVRVPAGAVIESTITASGSSATGRVEVVVLGHVL